MLDEVIDALTGVLTDGGVNAARSFSNVGLSLGQSLVCVSIGSCRALSPGMGDYIGYRTNEDGSTTELYVKRLELEAGFEVLSPFGNDFGEAACVALADEVTELLEAMPEGLRMAEITRGDISADETLGAFRCRVTLSCTAFFIAQSNEENAEFTDFILKGSVGNAD